MLLLSVQGIEMMNTRFDPLGVDLDGWSEAMGYSLENQEYDEVMAELYEKYKGRGQMSPEVKLIFMIISSATMFTISKKITKMDTSNMFTNLLGNVLGNQQAHPIPHQPQNVYHHTETTEDGPSKLKEPMDNIDINNILKTMNERKLEKQGSDAVSEDVLKNINLNNGKKGRGRPKKIRAVNPVV